MASSVFLDLRIDYQAPETAAVRFLAGRFNLQVNQQNFLGELSLYNRARRIVPGTRFAFYQKCWGGVMVNETELFYLVMLILLTLIIDLVLTMTGPRRDGKAHR